jgi:adenylate cyclase
MDADARTTLLDWTHQAALDGMDLAELLAGFCVRLRGAGVPVARGTLGIHTLHPTLFAYFIRWPAKGNVAAADQMRMERSEADRQERSPYRRLALSGETWLRRRLHAGEGVDEFPILADLRAEGATDYLCCRLRTGNQNGIAAVDAIASSWATDRAGGFADADVAALRALLPALSVAATGAAFAQIARNLAETYLGRDVGARVLAGAIARGEPEKIDAVIWFSDLAGFTRIADSAAPAEIISLLNDCAEAVVEAIHAAGGDVLKFMGDGVLALFSGAASEESCRRALAAALDARRRVAALNVERAAAGKPTTELYLGLHAGEVFYGNIGSRQRLDFTAVGPAVNEASRIAAMCRSLDRDLLTSAAFAGRAGDVRARLVSVGRYALRGVARPQELFTLDPDAG